MCAIGAFVLYMFTGFSSLIKSGRGGVVSNREVSYHLLYSSIRLVSDLTTRLESL